MSNVSPPSSPSQNDHMSMGWKVAFFVTNVMTLILMALAVGGAQRLWAHESQIASMQSSVMTMSDGSDLQHKIMREVGELRGRIDVLSTKIHEKDAPEWVRVQVAEVSKRLDRVEVKLNSISETLQRRQ